MFDFHDYPQDSKFFDLANKKVIGKMKDKFKGKVISEIIGLKSKMYSLIDVDRKENKKAKEVNKNVVTNMRHKEFVDVLFNKKWWDIRQKEFKVNCIELELIMFVKFLYFIFMIKDTYLIIALIF